jgi:hypothetical protein
VKHYVSTILQKEMLQKSLNMLEVQSQENQPKKLPIFISENSQFLFYFLGGQSGISKKKKNSLIPNLKKYYGN